MPIHNKQIAQTFSEIADLLEIQGENPFRVRAYRNATRRVDGLTENVSAMVHRGDDLTKLQGIGKDLAAKMRLLVTKGSIPQLRDLRKAHGQGLAKMMKVTGLGPKKVQALHKKLGIDSIQDLSKAVEKQQLRKVKGFGAKTEDNIKKSLRTLKTSSPSI